MSATPLPPIGSAPIGSAPIRIALIGAGTFARDAHLPSLLRHPDRFTIAAIFSRQAATAAALAQHIPYPVDIYTDLDELLAQPDIEAVDVLLPIAALPDAIARCLAAGKHLISEKPLAPDVATGQRLLALYPSDSPTVWMVGENWRYEAAFLHAADLVRRGEIGAPFTCHWAIYTPITANSKYYHTSWRRDSSFPGGFLLDGGVHHVAALRLILGEIVAVSAVARQNSPDLPPLDTLAATLTFANGCVGTYLATYATSAPWPPQLYIGGSRGSLRVQRREIEWTHEGQTERLETAGFDGVERELLAFADAIRLGEAHRNSPAEALADLRVVEALLTAAATGAPVRL
jgi:predicted dehydrogenase